MVVVEDEGDVNAFKDFVAEGTTAMTEPPVPAQVPAPVSAPQAPVSAPQAPVSAPQAPVSAPSGGRAIASPLARKLAAEQSYDLLSIKGTGPGGRIVAANVASYTPPAPAPTSPQTSTFVENERPVQEAGFTDFAVSPQSAAIAARLAYSMQSAPVRYSGDSSPHAPRSTTTSPSNSPSTLPSTSSVA